MRNPGGSDEIGRVSLAAPRRHRGGRRRAATLLVAPQVVRVEHDVLGSGPITIPIGQIERVEIADPAEPPEAVPSDGDCLDLSAGTPNLWIRFRAPVFPGRLRPFHSFRPARLAHPSRMLVCETTEPAVIHSLLVAAGVKVSIGHAHA